MKETLLEPQKVIPPAFSPKPAKIPLPLAEDSGSSSGDPRSPTGRLALKLKIARPAPRGENPGRITNGIVTFDGN